LEVVGQQLIEDNIVSVSRQMIDKEASVLKSKVDRWRLEANGEIDESEEE
jgi:26S proteasome regulatory subunit N11